MIALDLMFCMAVSTDHDRLHLHLGMERFHDEDSFTFVDGIPIMHLSTNFHLTRYQRIEMT